MTDSCSTQFRHIVCLWQNFLHIFHLILDWLGIFDIWLSAMALGSCTILWRFCVWWWTDVHIFVHRRNCGQWVLDFSLSFKIFKNRNFDSENFISFDFRIRGQLSTFFMHGRNIGILIAFALGSYFDYIESTMFFTGITIIFLVAIWFIPSSPQYFLQKGNIDVSFDRYLKYPNWPKSAPPSVHSISKHIFRHHTFWH